MKLEEEIAANNHEELNHESYKGIIRKHLDAMHDEMVIPEEPQDCNLIEQLVSENEAEQVETPKDEPEVDYTDQVGCIYP